MLDLVKGYAGAVVENATAAGHIGELARELSTFTAAVVSHPELRRALTDPTVGLVDRRAIAGELLASALEETSSLIGFAVRTERPAELPVVFALLVGVAEDAAHTPPIPSAQTSERHSSDRIRGYAERIFQRLDASGLDRLEDDLFSLSRVFDREAVLRHAVSDPTTPGEARAGIVTTLFSERVSPPALRIIEYVVAAGRNRDVVGSLEWLVGLVANERGRRLAEVRTAVELTDEEQRRLADALGSLVDRPVEIRIIIDPSVVGGMFVAVGDLVIDGTVRLRFERLRDALALASV